jgi:hypothetical protein
MPKRAARNPDEKEAEAEVDYRRVVVDAKAFAQHKRNHKQTRAHRAEPFVQVPLWWIEIAAKRIKSPATLVLIELLYAAWKAKSSTFPLPNVRLQRMGVSREIKRRVLRDLERNGVILVGRKPRRTPIITLIGL